MFNCVKSVYRFVSAVVNSPLCYRDVQASARMSSFKVEAKAGEILIGGELASS